MSLKQNFYGQTNCFNSLCLVKMCKRGKTLYMMMPIDFWCVCLESFILLFVPHLLILYFIQTTIWTLTNIQQRLNSDSWGETAQQCSLASALTVQKLKWRQRKLPARVRMRACIFGCPLCVKRLMSAFWQALSNSRIRCFVEMIKINIHDRQWYFMTETISFMACFMIGSIKTIVARAVFCANVWSQDDQRTPTKASKNGRIDSAELSLHTKYTCIYSYQNRWNRWNLWWTFLSKCCSHGRKIRGRKKWRKRVLDFRRTS